MDYKLIADTAILAGEIMLKSGAETYRVEDTMKHILDTAGAERAETIVMLTGIIVTINDPDADAITVMRRIRDRGTNMNRIVEVNEISRKYCAGEVSLEEIRQKLESMKGHLYSTWMYNLATVLVPAGFAPLFGGGIAEIAASAVTGAVSAALMTAGKKTGIGSFILNMLCSVGIAVTAVLLKAWHPALNMDTVIISGIMPLVPGVAITNAIRDTLRGDYISGGARVLEAFVTAASVAIGIGVGIASVSMLWRGGALL